MSAPGVTTFLTPNLKGVLSVFLKDRPEVDTGDVPLRRVLLWLNPWLRWFINVAESNRNLFNLTTGQQSVVGVHTLIYVSVLQMLHMWVIASFWLL